MSNVKRTGGTGVRFWRAVLLAMCAVIAMSGTLAACGDDGSESGSGSSEDLEVLFIGPSSGDLETFGAQVGGALEASIADVNENGGVLGRNLVLESINDEGDPGRGVSALRRYLDESGPPALAVLGVTSDSALAMMPIAMNEGVLAVTLGNSSELDDRDQFPLMYAAHTPYENSVAPLIGHLEAESVERVGLLVANNEQGATVEEAYENGLGEGSEIELVAVERYAPDALDMASQLQRIEREDPDALVFSAFGRAAGAILESVDRSGLDADLYGELATGSNNLASVAGADTLQNLNLIFYAAATAEDCEVSPRVAPAEERMVEGGVPMEPGILPALLAWEWPQMFAHAAEQADSVEPADVIDAVISDEFAETYEGTLYESYEVPSGKVFVASTDADFAVATGIRCDDHPGLWRAGDS